MSTQTVSGRHLFSSRSVKIGTLLIRAGYVTPEVFAAALELSKRTDQPVGTVLVKQKVLRKRDLSYALFIQTLIGQEALTLQLATDALRICAVKGISAENALSEMGWKRAVKEKNVVDLLVRVGWLNDGIRVRLNESGEMSISSNLLINGILNFRMINEAYKAMYYLRHHAIPLEQICTALLNSNESRSVSDNLVHERLLAPGAARTFLGDLIHSAGLVADFDILAALEASLLQGEFIGRELTRRALISERTLENALKLQELVSKEVMTKEEANTLLRMVVRENLSISEALQRSGFLATFEKASADAIRLLTLAGIITEEVVEIAMYKTKEFSLPALMALLATAQISRQSLNATVQLQNHIIDGRMTFDQAIMTLQLCDRTGCTVEEALDYRSHSETMPTANDTQHEATCATDIRSSRELQLQYVQLQKEQKWDGLRRLAIAMIQAAIILAIVSYFMPAQLSVQAQTVIILGYVLCAGKQLLKLYAEADERKAMTQIRVSVARRTL